MVFSSLVFIFMFLIGTLTIYYIVPKWAKNFVLFASSLIFYAWGEPSYIVIMLISTLIDYCAGIVIWKFGKNKAIRLSCLIVSIVMNLTLLGLFKYSGFVAENINAIAGDTVIDIGNAFFLGIGDLPLNTLPIGISFFTFQSMSYTIDMYRGEIEVQKNPINFGAFVTMFPQLVAGPIVRYSDISKEIDRRTVDIDKLYEGILRFVTGMGKKVLIANSIGAMWDTVLADVQAGSAVSVSSAWLGIIAYTLQIYFDFSGYSDMAIGLGKMLGFTFPENFNYPYLSKSISEFWRRWHITLGAFMREYLYIPLGGNRCSKGRSLLNNWIVFLVSGLWHGASWNFIVWGAWHGLWIVIAKLVRRPAAKEMQNAECRMQNGGGAKHLLSVIRYPLSVICPARIAGTAWTFLMVMFGWVFFAAVDFRSAAAYFRSLAGCGGTGTTILADLTPQAICAMGVGTILSFIPSLVPKLGIAEWRIDADGGNAAIWSRTIATAILLLLATLPLLTSGFSPFIYNRF